MKSPSPLWEWAFGALQPTDYGEPLQVVGSIPSYVLASAGLVSAAAGVWMNRETAQHIRDRRRKHAQPGDSDHAIEADVHFVLTHMPRVLLRPTYFGPYLGQRSDALKLSLVDMVEEEGRWLHIAVKFVFPPAAHSGRDEIWISTGYALGHGSLRRYLKTGKLVAVQSG